MNFNIKKLVFLALSLIVLSACKKNNDESLPPIFEVKKGFFVLNQGGFTDNNASLGYYGFNNEVKVSDAFKLVNNRNLGGIGNDIKVYGSKMYIVMNASGTVEVVDRLSVNSIKQVSLKNGETNRQPRYIVFNKNKAFISSYDGTVAVLDTASLTIDKYIAVGRNPEQMAITNGKLYVANSGGLDFPNYDNTVSVIDLTTLEEIKKITVVTNPGGIAVDKYGDVYVKSEGNYEDVSPALNIIDSTTDLVKQTIDNFDGSNMTVSGDIAYFSTYTSVKVFDVTTEKVIKEQFVSDATEVKIPYSIAVNETNDEVFILDAVDYAGSNGKVFCFDRQGNKKYVLTVGLLPTGLIFVN